MDFKKRNLPAATTAKDIGTVIGSGIELENGILKGMGIVRVDGVVTGEIRLEGHLILGETGKIVGEVYAGSAMFLGTYEGNVYVEDTLHITASAHVYGNVRTGKLIIDEGADFHGTCNMDTAKLDSRKIISFIKEIDGENRMLDGEESVL